jgi:drug/metabolite transporter (DMT)-like permease
MALGGLGGSELIDPVTYTTLRLVSGALFLLPIALLTAEPKPSGKRSGSWASGLALFVYAITFSLAYISLSAGTGALILFGAVQATMIGAGLRSGERLSALQWLGLGAAIGGLFYLVLPGITAPDPLGAALMLVAGIAWGVYSLRGRGVSAPIAAIAGNFLRAAPLAILVSVVAHSLIHFNNLGVVLAVVSGAVTSGLGYVLWYTTLRGLTATTAAILQLLVPVIAALGGVAFLSETLSIRLLIASALILGGVALAVIKQAETR